MFSGIIEITAQISSIIPQENNLILELESKLSPELHINQSLAHNGICLTVVELSDTHHKVVAVGETISKTTISGWQNGQIINLERCTPANGRFDGHIVQGHVDAVGHCLGITPVGGSWQIDFGFPHDMAALLVEKGSICIDGVSLTVFDVGSDSFRVAIIPYTYLHTHFGSLRAGMAVNLEFDVIGKYVNRMMQLRS